MNSENKFRYCQLSNIIFIILNILTVSFIFIHSSMTSDVSADESGNVTNFLQYIFPFELSDHIVRKTAHFVEFFGLGVITSLTVFSFYKTPLKGTFIKLFICLFTGVVDEYIQLGVPGRSGEIADALLDFAGSVTGIIVTALIIFLVIIIKKKRN